MAIIKVYNGSSWIAPNVKHYNGTSWIDPEMKFYNGTDWVSLEAGVGGPTVTIRANGAFNSRLSNTCYAGVQFATSGTEYEYTPNGSLASAIAWLLTGVTADVWVMWTRTGGTLSDWNNLGVSSNNVRLKCNVDRSYRIIRSASGTNSIIGSFKMFDAATGGNTLFTSSGVTWSAEFDFDPCPLCCFTPETLVTLASGLQVPIGTVTKGTEILVFNPRTKKNEAQEVTGIITRSSRAMYRITFDDGRYLDASDDHPFDVKGKGPASINPVIEYKDLGMPMKLEVNDIVPDQEGRPHGITQIEEIDYPGTVYTFENSLFYASGLLVY